MIPLAFLIGVATDYVWAMWHRACAQKRPVRAANWSIGIFLCGMCWVWFIASDQWLCVAFYILGAWLGTYLAVRLATKESHYEDDIV